jgi:hypothetical protein
MNIVGCDFHPGWQQVAVLETETGELSEYKLKNGNGDAERFYRQLASPALIGIEASGNSQWFEDLLARMGHELWIGDAAQIRAQGSCESGGSAQVSGTTLLDPAHQHGVSGDRSHREQTAVTRGRRKLDREIDWALSHPDGPVQKTAQKSRLGKRNLRSTFAPTAATGYSHGKSWSCFRPYRWMVKRFASRKVIQRNVRRTWSSTELWPHAVSQTPDRTTLSLTQPSPLSTRYHNSG